MNINPNLDINHYTNISTAASAEDYEKAAAAISNDPVYEDLINNELQKLSSDKTEYTDDRAQYAKDRAITLDPKASHAEKISAWKDEQKVEKDEIPLVQDMEQKMTSAISKQLTADYNKPHSDIRSIMQKSGLNESDIAALSQFIVHNDVPAVPHTVDPIYPKPQ